MFGVGGKKRTISLDDGLGSLIPAGTLSLERTERALIEAISHHRFLAGHGVPSIPTRFVVHMSPSDRAWMSAGSEDVLARALESYADRSGSVVVGAIDVSFRADRRVPPGAPQVWAGFAEDDLMVLSSPGAAAEVFAAR